MMPKLLAALEFRSNNGAHRPLLDALDVIRRAEGEGRQYFRADEVAIEGVIRPKWRDLVIEDAPGDGQRINRINYEIPRRSVDEPSRVRWWSRPSGSLLALTAPS